MNRFVHFAIVAALMAAPSLASAVQNDIDQWSDAPGLAARTDAAALVATDSGALYLAVRSIQMPAFQRYTEETRTWTAMAPPPLPADRILGDDLRMAHRPGTPYIYLAPGWNTSDFYEYDITAGTWRTLDPLPYVINLTYHFAMTGTTDKLYAFGGGFREYSPSSSGPGTWTLLTSPPVSSSWLGLAWPGAGDFLYAVGDSSTLMWRYSISGNSWTSVGILPMSGRQQLAELTGSSSGSLFAVRYGSTGAVPSFQPFVATFHRFDIAAGTWSALPSLPSYVNAGVCLALPRTGSDTVSIVAGYTPDVWRYSISRNLFATDLAMAPGPIYTGGAMAGVNNGDDLYVMNSHIDFFRYSTAADEWTSLTPRPGPSLSGGGLAYPGSGDYLYATRGASNFLAAPSPDFYRYSLRDDLWEPLPPVPVAVTEQGRFVHGGGDRFFAVTGAGVSVMQRYDADEGTWSTTSPMPAGDALSAGTFGTNLNLVYPGSGDLLYVIVGDTFVNALTDLNRQEFRSYNISTDTWGRLADLPVLPNITSLCHPGFGDTIYGFLTSSLTTLWAYSIRENTWSTRASAPGVPQISQSLAHPGGRHRYMYALAGGLSPYLWRYHVDVSPFIVTLDQLRLDGTTPLPAGGITFGEDGFTGSITAADPLGEALSMELEVRPVGQAFTGVPTTTVPELSPGPTLSASESGLQMPAAYHWQARVINETGRSSRWASFGLNPDDPAEPDFIARPNAAPEVVGPAQVEAGSGAPIHAGSILYFGSTIRFEAGLTDADGDIVRLEIEVQDVGRPYTGLPTFVVLPEPAGTAASVTMEPALGSFRWQYRAVDAYGADSGWTGFGGNGAEEADYSIHLVGSAGRRACALSGGSGRTLPALVFLALLATARAARRNF